MSYNQKNVWRHIGKKRYLVWSKHLLSCHENCLLLDVGSWFLFFYIWRKYIRYCMVQYKLHSYIMIMYVYEEATSDFFLDRIYLAPKVSSFTFFQLRYKRKFYKTHAWRWIIYIFINNLLELCRLSMKTTT